ATVGSGLILLAVLWGLALLLLTVSARAHSGLRFIGVPVLLLTGLVTAILVTMPRGDSQLADASAMFDAMYVPRVVLLLLFSLLALSSGLVYFQMAAGLRLVPAETAS
ncbi:hypothetical protein BOX15_Mlig019803g1, partial [Macrostomum lignano]